MTPRGHRADLSLAEAFEMQARHCAALGSPFYGRLLPLIPDALPEGPVRARLESWPGSAGNRADAVPLRLMGGLNALARAGIALRDVWPPHEVGDEALADAIARAAADHPAALLRYLDGPPQTNEVRRAAAIIPALHLLSARHGLPITLSELGASAGLNLLADRFALETPEGVRGPSNPVLELAPDWSGPVPADAPPRIAGRAGCDRAPVDPSDPNQRARLLSYLWPDQPFREELTEAAIAAGPPPVETADAVAWLERRLAAPPAGLHLVFHTVFRQYLPPEADARMEALLAQAGARATAETPLAHLSMEGDGGNEEGAAIDLTTWPGGVTERLGRICFHGRWVRWQVAA